MRKLSPGGTLMLVAKTPAYAPMPDGVSGGCAAEPLECASIRHAPPSAAAPTRPLAAATGAPAARDSASIKALPGAPSPVRQLHSSRSPSGLNASPIAASSSAC